VALLRI